MAKPFREFEAITAFTQDNICYEIANNVSNA